MPSESLPFLPRRAALLTAAPLLVVLVSFGLTGACGGGDRDAGNASGDAASSSSADTAGGESGMVDPEGTAALAAAVEADDDWLEEVLGMSHRSAENKARDPYRHPVETLTFFGIRPGMTVVELNPGGGWYTEILAPALGPDGTLIATITDPEGDPEYYGTRLAQKMVERVGSNPEVYGNVQTVVWEPPEKNRLGEPGSADAVVTFRNFHGWIRRDQATAVLGAAFEVLKPGGVFGVVQHRAPEGAELEAWVERGYVPEADLVALIESAGFQIEARSEVNANRFDTKDYPEGVWTLPPTYRLGDQDRQRYRQIGESDRMTLKFVKPAY